jgi:hypothetical protein
MPEATGLTTPKKDDHESTAELIAMRLHMIRHKPDMLASYFHLREAYASDEWRDALVLFLQRRRGRRSPPD